MAVNMVDIGAPREDVFATLVDPHTYPQWLIGCQDIRVVDDGWPAPGTRFHHRVGLGPFTVADYTESLAVDRGQSLALRVRARPLLRAARVVYELQDNSTGTRVVMTERPLAPATRRLWNPLIDGLTRLRNRRSLERLKNMVEARATIKG